MERPGPGTALIFTHEIGETSSRPSPCEALIFAPSMISIQLLFVVLEVSWQAYRAHVESALPPTQSSDCGPAEPRSMP